MRQGRFDDRPFAYTAKWPSGKAEACKAFTPGSNPGFASRICFGRLRASVFFYLSPARGEQTDSLNANLNPAVDAIGKQWQMEGHMFEIREDLPADIATVQWETMAPTEFSVAMPFYSALLTEASPYFKTVDMDTSHSGEGNFSEIQNKTEYAMAEEPEGSIDYVLIDITTLAYNHRDSMAAGTRAYLDALQKQIIAQHDLVDAVMQATPAEQRGKLANHAHQVMVEQTYLKCDKLLDEMRAYIKAGEQAFFCRVTNAAGKSADSDVAVITVKAPAKQPGTTTPGGTTTDANHPAKKPVGDLPQTGDPMSIAILGGIAASGIAAAVAGIKRRNTR